MKRIQRKDALRNIGKQKVSWFAIVVIAMLSVTAYLGIHFASRGIAANGNAFYDATHFRDAEIISTLLITPDDMDAILAVEGVADAEGVYQTSGTLKTEDAEQKVDVVSLTERVSTPLLLEGRLPETDGECAVEKPVMDALGLTVGDTVSVTDARGGSAAYLLRDSFVVTGVVDHPDHASWPTQVPGNRDVVVRPEAFDREALDGCWMKAELLMDGTAGLDRFGAEYLAVVSEVLDRLETLRTERTAIRSGTIRAQAQEEIDAGRAELDAGRTELEEARAELDDGWDALADGERELADARQQLDDGQQKLTDSEAELAEGKQQLDDGQARIDSSYDRLMAAWNELNDGEAAYAASGAELDAARQQLDDAAAELDAGRAQLDEAERQLAEGRAELVSGYEQIEAAKSSIRGALYDALYGVIGAYADRFSWGAPAEGVDPDDASATACVLSVTDGITVDLAQSMTDNIFALVASLGVPEEELRSAYETAAGRALELAEGESVLGAVVRYAVELYGNAESGYESFAEAARAWDAGHAEYLAGRGEYEARLADYDAGLSAYNAGLAEYEDGLARYRQARQTLDEGWAAYESALAEYDAGRAELQAGQTAYQTGLAEYEAGRATYDEGLAAYESGLAEWESSRTELEDGEAQYADGFAEYEEGQARLADAQAQLDALDECRWVILSVEGNPSYLSVRSSVNNTADMGMTFALVFVLVGALVIYATVGRIVDEQRKLVGAAKALGLYNREILAKYLAFGLSGTVLGMLLGTAGGYFGIQRLLLYVYGRYYVFGAGKSVFLGRMTAVVFAAGAALSALAVWSACTALMRSTATSLMQEKAPETRHKARARTGRRGSLYARLILLNMRSDKKRVAVTVVSVAGCCALLVAGFTMRQSVMKALDAQFDEIARYDVQIRFDPEVSAAAEHELEELLTAAGTDWVPLHASRHTFSVDGELMSANLLAGELADLDRFYVRLDPQEDEALPRTGEGIWIQQRIREVCGVSAGDTITLYDGAMKPCELPVAGVFRIYAGQEMILAAEQYEAFFGHRPEHNAFFLRLNGADIATLREAILAIDGVEEITEIAETRALYQSLASVLNLIALMFVGIAGLMAYFILLNLVNMYINQKKRELTIMRVNGFTVREVNRYVLREMIVSTALGIVLGLGAGALLGRRVIGLLENTSVRFMRGVQWEAWLIAALITAGFAAAVIAAALRKVRYLRLTDVA